MSDRPNSKLAREERRASLRARAAAATEHISPQVSRTGSGSSHFEASSRRTLPDARSVSPGLGASFGSASMVSAHDALNESQIDRDTQRKIALERAEMLLKMELPKKPLDNREHSAPRNSEGNDKSDLNSGDMPFTANYTPTIDNSSSHTNPAATTTDSGETTAEAIVAATKAERGEEEAAASKAGDEGVAAATEEEAATAEKAEEEATAAVAAKKAEEEATAAAAAKKTEEEAAAPAAKEAEEEAAAAAAKKAEEEAATAAAKEAEEEATAAKKAEEVAVKRATKSDTPNKESKVVKESASGSSPQKGSRSKERHSIEDSCADDVEAAAVQGSLEAPEDEEVSLLNPGASANKDVCCCCACFPIMCKCCRRKKAICSIM